MGRKVLVIFLLVCFLFNLSISREIIVEDKGDYIFLKNVSETKIKHKIENIKSIKESAINTL